MRPYIGMLVMVSSTRIGTPDRRNSLDVIVHTDNIDGHYIETKPANRTGSSRSYKGPLDPLPQYETVIIPVLE